jgi:ribosome maturation factor RimP
MKLDQIREAAERVARSAGMDILDVEWKVGKQRMLRIYLDRPPSPDQPQGGVISHQDCEFVSQQMGVIMDAEDMVPGSNYILEVSSPGLDRKLVKTGDYERFQGRRARLWLTQPVEGQTYFDGRLAGYSGETVRLEVKEHVMEVPLANIRKANLVVEF